MTTKQVTFESLSEAELASPAHQALLAGRSVTLGDRTGRTGLDANGKLMVLWNDEAQSSVITPAMASDATWMLPQDAIEAFSKPSEAAPSKAPHPAVTMAIARMNAKADAPVVDTKAARIAELKGYAEAASGKAGAKASTKELSAEQAERVAELHALGKAVSR